MGPCLWLLDSMLLDARGGFRVTGARGSPTSRILQQKHGERKNSAALRGKGKWGGESQMTFKGPDARTRANAGESRAQRHKVREEVELRVENAATLAQIFERLGMPAAVRYEKYRTTFRLPGSQPWAKGLLIELDETPIGTF